MDPPIDRFRDSLYCLSSPVSSVASSPPDTSYISPNNDKYNFCDEKTDISSQSGKVPFPEFGVDLIRASPFNRDVSLESKSLVDSKDINEMDNEDNHSDNDINNQ